jgi:phospholipase C
MKGRFTSRSRGAIGRGSGIFLFVCACSAASAQTTTPITKVVVIFQENVSFDHYFATYPVAQNPPGEPAFLAAPGTPPANGLSGMLLTNNPNSVAPFRLDRSQAATCDQDHDYTPEQQAMHGGLMDRFPEFTGAGAPCPPGQVMGYFDGNTVTALWNYAQTYAMSDNFFDTGFGPSTPGHLNLVSGQTHGVNIFNQPVSSGDVAPGSATVIGDPQPYYDDCSSRETVGLSGKNVGDLLNTRGLTWGWFQGGFRRTGTDGTGKAMCASSHIGSDGKPKGDYIPHHEPFQYYASTSNPHHLPPSSTAMIGQTDQANHQYDLADFFAAASAGNLPSVSYIKAPGYLDGHAGYSDPLAEQSFLADTINRLQQLPDWNTMAIFIAWDDSDGWYDHVMPPIVSKSNTSADALTGPSIPGVTPSGDCGIPAPGAYLGRCGYGQRLPFLVISPYAKRNYVDHTVTDLSSILKFIEDDWSLGRIGDQSFDSQAGSLLSLFDFSLGNPSRRLTLDTATGQPSQVLPTQSGRFQASVTWSTAGGRSGSGNLTYLSADSGAFWFFSPDNIDLVVKVLDGRSLNGKFWVFYGSLTNEQFTLTVTDTVTGAQRTYTNAQGQVSSGADTTAF